MTVPPGRGDPSGGGSGWRPTLALAALGVLSTAALTCLSVCSVPSADPGPTRTAGLVSESAAVLEGGMAPVSATATGRGGVRFARQPILTQLPVRPEPGLRDKVDLGLPAILLAAPRGQVLEQTVVAPAERQLLLMRAAAPVLQVAGPLLGVDGTELVEAIAQAGAGVPADPSGIPTLTMVTPAVKAPADAGQTLAVGGPVAHGGSSAPAGSGTDARAPHGTATDQTSDPATTESGAPASDGSAQSSPQPGSSGTAAGASAGPSAPPGPTGPGVPPSPTAPADPPSAPRTSSPAPRATTASPAPRPAPPPATPRPNTADPDPRVSPPRSVADGARTSTTRTALARPEPVRAAVTAADTPTR
ncbi:hypothetical protein [Arsenicicoccus dermatophilus]|uniref:hypothetical protein n=1 Tax=Arsenicicoccus dermatophilus TaxID=1076331 RepID=UPI0039176215